MEKSWVWWCESVIPVPGMCKQDDGGLGSPRRKIMRPYLKIKLSKKAGVMAQVVEHLSA
jgi:hypothetical protein